jgi:hypothetical protein
MTIAINRTQDFAKSSSNIGNILLLIMLAYT